MDSWVKRFTLELNSTILRGQIDKNMRSVWLRVAAYTIMCERILGKEEIMQHSLPGEELAYFSSPGTAARLP
jgi:hypothetical protein